MKISRRRVVSSQSTLNYPATMPFSPRYSRKTARKFLADSRHEACSAPHGMNPQAEELKQRTKRFALNVLAVVRTLPATDEARDVGGQLRRAATGAASNYRATCRSRSDAEFVAKIGNALEEADESGFWLEVIVEGRIFNGQARCGTAGRGQSAVGDFRAIENHCDRTPQCSRQVDDEGQRGD